MPPVFRRAGPRCREIVTQNFGRFGVKRHVERSPEQIDATACERWRVIWISPEFRPAVIRCPPPPIREWPVAALGVERPDVEVLDAIRSVQIVEGSPLTQRPAQSGRRSAPHPAGDARTVLLRHPQRARPAAGGHSCRCARAIASDGSPSTQDPIQWSGGKLPKAAGAPGDSRSICVDTSAARESWSSVDVACRFGCCILLVRACPSLAASTSNDGRGVCPAGFLPLEVVAAADRAPSYPRPAHPVHVRSAAKSAPSCVSESACLRWAYGRCASSHVLAVHG